MGREQGKQGIKGEAEGSEGEDWATRALPFRNAGRLLGVHLASHPLSLVVLGLQSCNVQDRRSKW